MVPFGVSGIIMRVGWRGRGIVVVVVVGGVLISIFFACGLVGELGVVDG